MSSEAKITIRRAMNRAILAALEHHRQVVEGGVGVGRAGSLIHAEM